MNHLYLYFKGLKVPSTNSSRAVSFKTKRQYKTDNYKLFEKEIVMTCLGRAKEIREFERSFDGNNHHLSYSAIFWIPMGKMLTKTGRISHHSGDFDNYLKTSTDAVFKCFEKLDDKFIKHVSGIDYLVSDDGKYNFLFKLATRENSLLFEPGEA